MRYKLCDQDADGIGDSIDQDDDNDGLLDIIEGNGAADTDNDGFPDSRDLDSDNDGLTDVREAAGLDTNGDALSDGTTTTQGVPTSANNGAGLTPQNADSDRVGNWRDLDSDNDGLNDVREGNNPDANNDSFADSPDSDSDGIPNSVDGKTGFGDANDPILPDTDLDSRYSPYDIDSDNDSIPDLFESNNSQLDSNADARADGADTDNDGIVQALDGSPSYGDSLDPITPDTDGDSIGDPYDSDSDDDAIPDYIEAQQGSSYLLLSRHDSDGDGLDDAYDLRP